MAYDAYRTQKDFVAYFLQSPVTKEPEFEIRISTSEVGAIEEFQKLLRENKVEFRRIGLEIFPPPLIILLEASSMKGALAILLAWYKKNKDKGIDIKFVRADASVQSVNNEAGIQNEIAHI